LAKTKTIYYCSNCGANSPKWIGKCPTCGEWNTYQEEIVQKTERKSALTSGQKENSHPIRIGEVKTEDMPRLNTQNQEFNRVLGGGIVPGSLILVGGEPGIGKSTLVLQIALNIAGIKVLYISGEESEQQLKMRAERVGIHNRDVIIYTETIVQNIFRQIDDIKPDLIIVDSIQTMQTEHLESAAGSISQIRECAADFQKFSKKSKIPVILIGHITKDGTLAGPKLLEHMVDTVLQFEGDRNYGYRILRSVKNRFGSTAELGIFEMYAQGLREVSNPSDILLSQRTDALSGISVAAMVEGLRPWLIETQALVSTAVYGTPQRSSTGFDIRRLNMLLAVLEKRSGFKLSNKDVFLNIAGGIKVDDPAIDLSVISAILSSNEDIPVDRDVCFAGEVGLSGEIRAVNRIEQRIAEADKLGFQKIFVSKYNLKGLDISKFKIEIIAVTKVENVFEQLFG
jgi:DNA repair protein RadA/Sms